MMMRLQRMVSGCCLLAWLLAPQAWSAQVYSWTDAGGVTHYSETAPAGDPPGLTVLEIAAPVAATPVDDDYYSVARQAARMEARRLEKERIRAEILRAEAEARQADAAAGAAAREQATEQAEDRGTRYYPVYPWYPWYGHRPYPGYRDYPRIPPHKPHRPSRNKKLVVSPDHP